MTWDKTKHTTVLIDKELRNKLKTVKITRRETYNEIVYRLFNNYCETNKVKKKKDIKVVMNETK